MSLLVRTRGTTDTPTDDYRHAQRRGAWYPDPYGKADLRWWDGGKWSPDVRGYDEPDVRPAAEEAAVSAAPDVQARPAVTALRPRTSVAAAVSAVVLLGIVVAVVALVGGSGSSRRASTSAPTAAAVSHAMSSATVDQVSCVTDLGSAPRTIASLAATSGLQLPQARDRGPVYAYGCSGTSGTSYVAFVDRDENVIEYGQQRLGTEAQAAARP